MSNPKKAAAHLTSCPDKVEQPEEISFEGIKCQVEVFAPDFDQRVKGLVERAKFKGTTVLAIMCVAEGLRRKARKSALAMGIAEAQLVEFERAAGIASPPKEPSRLVGLDGRPLQ